MKKGLFLFVSFGALLAAITVLERPVKVQAQPYPGTIQAGAVGQSPVYVAAHTLGPSGGGGGTTPIFNGVIFTNEQVLSLTTWANSPSGAVDMSISGQTYSISAASAFTSFSNTRTTPYMNFVSFNVTNPGASTLAITVSASAYTSSDGTRTFYITNGSQREIRLESSVFGVRGISTPYY